MFDSNHPAIISMNNNLITSYTYSKKDKEAKKIKILNIIEKNYEIASRIYRNKSIYKLVHISNSLFNRIAIGDISLSSQTNQLIMEMKEILTNFNNGDRTKLANQYFI